MNVNNELDSFSHWCRANFLTVNTAKTKCMLFTTSRVRVNTLLTLYLNGSRLGFVSMYRYLGIDLDNEFTQCPE